MRNIVLTIAYDGTNYCGWQVQPEGKSISLEIINAVYKITKEKVKLYGSGRTDAGVHAYAQVANFYTESAIPAERLIGAINAYLPSEIVITNAYEADSKFNARFSAAGKIYEYKILNAPLPSPFWVNKTWHIKYKLDIQKMSEICRLLEGEHDFKAFMASGSFVKDTVRTLYELSIKKENDIITITAKGSGFLYNMVRIITGTLVQAGSGKLSAEDVKNILSSLDRTKGAITAPACGLYLKEVLY